MTDKVQKIRKEVEKLHGNPYYMMAVKDILKILDMQEEPVNGGLEEAAFDYAETCKYEGGEKLLCVEHFKAGVKWQKEQFEKDYTNLCNGIATVKGLAVAMTYNKGVADTKEQMIEKAVETTFNVSLPSSLYDKLWIKGCKEGDKLLVIKKEEL